MDRFPTALRGYRREEVDAVMARIDGTLGRAPLTAAPITPQELGQTRFGVVLRGYDRAAVDGAMIDAAAALGGAPTPPPGYGPPPSPPPGYEVPPGVDASGPPPGYEAPPGPVPGGESPEAARDRVLGRLREPLETTSFGPGYDKAEVNRYVEYATAALSGAAPPLTPDAVRSATFTTTSFRGGYAEEAVDFLLDELITYLERYGSR